ATDRGVAPRLAAGTGHTLAVQDLGNRDRARAGGKQVEDAPHRRRLCRVDRPIAAYSLAACVESARDDVAVTETAAGLAGLNPARQTAVGLGRQVLEEEGVHGALEADMELGDFA